MITTLDELAPAQRAAVQAYLDAVAAATDPELRDAVVGDLRADLLDRLDADADEAAVAALLAAAGPVEAAAKPDPRHGRIGGMPYDVRPPSGRKIAATWWNPRDERLFVPRVFGGGWTPNFGAFAVRLGLIEPDAEDEPFASTPPRAFLAALVVPAALTAAVAAHYLVRRLPDELPAHFDLAGRPDRWEPRARAAVTDLAVTALPTLWAGLVLRSGGARAAGSLAAAAAASSVPAANTLWRTAALDGRARPWAGPGLVGGMFAAAGGVLVWLARAGRRAEQDRDLS